MKNVKLVYFDSVGIEPVTFVGKLRTLCKSIYVVKEGVVFVNYVGSSKDLFEHVFPDEALGYILIADLDDNTDSYWGFMNKDLWIWLDENRE